MCRIPPCLNLPDNFCSACACAFDSLCYQMQASRSIILISACTVTQAIANVGPGALVTCLTYGVDCFAVGVATGQVHCSNHHEVLGLARLPINLLHDG